MLYNQPTLIRYPQCTFIVCISAHYIFTGPQTGKMLTARSLQMPSALYVVPVIPIELVYDLVPMSANTPPRHKLFFLIDIYKIFCVTWYNKSIEHNPYYLETITTIVTKLHYRCFQDN